MRIVLAIVMICAGAVMVSCGDTDRDVERPDTNESGAIVVHVYWDGQGLADRRVRLVELGLEMTTDENGIARFEVSPGDYTVRAYDINQGGPALRELDTDVTVPAGETVRIEIVDCLPCV